MLRVVCVVVAMGDVNLEAKRKDSLLLTATKRKAGDSEYRERETKQFEKAIAHDATKLNTDSSGVLQNTMQASKRGHMTIAPALHYPYSLLSSSLPPDMIYRTLSP